jgi:hypothetical protein
MEPQICWGGQVVKPPFWPIRSRDMSWHVRYVEGIHSDFEGQLVASKTPNQGGVFNGTDNIGYALLKGGCSQPQIPAGKFPSQWGNHAPRLKQPC